MHRSLTTSQRALIAAGFLEYEREQAKARQGARTDMVEKFPQGEEGKARDKAGERMHVSGRTVDDAAKVIAHGVPKLMERVRSGDIPRVPVKGAAPAGEGARCSDGRPRRGVNG